MDLPEITEVQRLTLKPGDRIIVRTPERLDMESANHVRTLVHAVLRLPDDVPVLVLPDGMSLEVLDGATAEELSEARLAAHADAG